MPPEQLLRALVPPPAPAYLLLKKWPWKELILSPLLQRMRMTASQAVGRVRLRRSSADSLGPSRPAWKDG